eukprot:364241-Chlamydomonas_euryale.AAC.11
MQPSCAEFGSHVRTARNGLAVSLTPLPCALRCCGSTWVAIDTIDLAATRVPRGMQPVLGDCRWTASCPAVWWCSWAVTRPQLCSWTLHHPAGRLTVQLQRPVRNQVL